jgi:hypothetical protein
VITGAKEAADAHGRRISAEKGRRAWRAVIEKNLLRTIRGRRS